MLAKVKKMHSAVASREKKARAMEMLATILRIMFRFESRKVCLLPVRKKRIVAISVSDRNTTVRRVSLSNVGNLRLFFLVPAAGSGGVGD